MRINKMIKNILILTMLFFSINIYAKKVIKVDVSGLVCDFCARGLELNFKDYKEVTKFKVSLEKSIITLEFKDEKKINNDLVKKIINDNGFTVNKITQD